MNSRSWTELFFMDEAVALAAGHRPCFLCRRASAEAYRSAWAVAKGITPPSAFTIDRVLHGERISCGRRRIHALPAPLSELPDGAVVTASGFAYTVAGGLAFRWTESGYEQPKKIRVIEGLLTPPSSFMALQAGYRAVLHPVVDSFNARSVPT
jgi:hypothetical protein